MAKREVKPTEQDTHPPRTDMEKLEEIKKIVYEHLPYPNVAIRNDLVEAIKEIDKILDKKYQ